MLAEEKDEDSRQGIQSIEVGVPLLRVLADHGAPMMLRDLARDERTVGQLAEPFAISLAAASKHIKALESAGLIRREVRGRTHVCRLEAGPLCGAHEWLAFYEKFWSQRLDALERLLRADAARAPSTRKGRKK